MHEAEAHEPSLAARSVRLVCFQLHEQELALPIADVRETLRVPPITRVFLTPEWLLGILSLRGEIVPAIDLALWLGLRPTGVEDASRLVVLRRGGKVLGVVVDELRELRSIEPDQISGPPPTLSPEQLRLLAGVAGTPTGTVRILSPEAIFASERLRSLESIA